MRAASQVFRRVDEAPLAVSRLIRDARKGERRLYLAAMALTVGLAPLMAFLQIQIGFALALGLLIIAILIIIMLIWPIAGVYALAICAVVVEQEILTYPIVTDHLYIFYWPVNLQGLPERPIGFLALFALLLIIARRLAKRMGAPLKLGPLFWPFAAMLACVAMGVAHGLSSGGDPRIIVLEVRPFWYLFLTYLLAYNLINEKRHALALLWITVIGTSIKALQGTYIVFGPLGGHISGQNEIMAHEQSFFFVLVLLIILLCVMLGRMRLLMWAALLSTPFLLVALVANNRRADYAAFLLGALGAWLFAVVVRPERRKALITAAVISGVVFGVYVLAFQHSSSTLGTPARAVISVVHPSAADVRDAASNAYRYVEDYDLKFTEQQNPVIGYGFGKPFLQPITLPNIVSIDPYYLYIPHNTLLWVWMRLGPPGYLALWYLIGAFVIRTGILARTLRDPDLRFIAIYAIGAMLMEVPLAYGDYQLFFYRNIFYLGLLMGTVMRLRELDTPTPATETTETRDEAGAGAAAQRKTLQRVTTLTGWEREALSGVAASLTSHGARPARAPTTSRQPATRR
ncbi:MAG TPA: O-antigen ligase family protein [Ktedonobacterales bacterium]|nr:O-antigen ligase family protein [Ktedonobacterales bacterium]